MTLAVRQPFVITDGPSSSRVAMNVLRRVLNSGSEWGLERPLRSLFSTLNTWNCATADRTISFRQVAPQRQLDC